MVSKYMIAAVVILAAVAVTVTMHIQQSQAPSTAITADDAALRKEAGEIDKGRQKFLSTPFTKDTNKNPIKQ